MPEPIFEFTKLSNNQVQDILDKNGIELTIDEARRVEKEILGRPVTLTEAIAFGIEGSEHTSYRSSKKYLPMFHTTGPHVAVGPGEDAGIVWITKIDDKDYGLAIGHESHNHPSQVVPYEGAATGIGGLVRDIVCMGAKVVATADPLRFGEISSNKTKWIFNGVTSGIGGYGNPLGIPNIAGDAFFNESFNANSLVNVVALGTVALEDIIHSKAPVNAAGYNFILIGKPTDNSGFGGTTFASGELDEADSETNKSAVQEPNAFLERHILASTYDLFEKLKEQNLLKEVGFKDLGAGGILCASVELAEAGGYGAKIDLDKVHVSMDNLLPAVMLCSETQERFMWVASEKATQVILEHYNKTWDFPNVSSGAQAGIIGTVQAGNYQVFYKGEKIMDAKPEDVTAGLTYERQIKEHKHNYKEPNWTEIKEMEETILDILAHPAVASKKPIYEQYDKNVQGHSVIEAGMADAGVIAPLLDEGSSVGIALSVDGNARYGKLSAYWQGVNAAIESMRNVAAVGAAPWCLTDCLNYGNPEKPEQMWDFAEGVRGVAEAAKSIMVKGYENTPVPIVSGNVSFYNQSKDGAINPSAIIGCIGRLEDAATAISMEFIQSGNTICVLGERKNELGGSVLYDLYNEYGANVPQPDVEEANRQIAFITDIIQEGLVPSCHDISEGGLLTTLAEMCFGGRGDLRTGIEIDMNKVIGPGLTVTQKLFTETGGFVFEIDPRLLKSVEKYAQRYNLQIYNIGIIREDEAFIIKSGNEQIVNLTIGTLAERWTNGLREALR